MLVFHRITSYNVCYTKLLRIGGCGIILPEAHVRYRAEMFLGDRLQIGVRTELSGKSSFVMVYRIERDGVVTAEGSYNFV